MSSLDPVDLSDPSMRLIFLDLEMTGLNPATERVIEAAAIATDPDLNPLDEGIQCVVKTEKKVLDAMGEWCTEHHGQSGLIDACLNSPYSMSEVDSKLHAYVSRHIPEKGKAVLAGNSIHLDKEFIRKDLPLLAAHLHYRLVDVSAIKEVSKRWYPTLLSDLETARKAASKTDGPGLAPIKDSKHRALDDVKDSIAELKFYREHIFRPAPSEIIA